MNTKGLDTVAKVLLNDQLLFTSKNQFVSNTTNVKQRLHANGNVLRIEFESPVKYAENQSNAYAVGLIREVNRQTF